MGNMCGRCGVSLDGVMHESRIGMLDWSSPSATHTRGRW